MLLDVLLVFLGIFIGYSFAKPISEAKKSVQNKLNHKEAIVVDLLDPLDTFDLWKRQN